MYEVELKFPVADLPALERRLAELAGRFYAPVDQVDRYFNHPCRDFAQTDEALRLRHDGDGVAITWKGPRIDAATKTRREIELPLFAPLQQGGDATPPAVSTIAEWTELLEALGFRPVATVSKQRRPVHLHWHGMEVAAALDNVAGVGAFLELEILATEADVPQARTCLESLARELGCGPPERRSYLELLLESQAAP